MNDFFERLDVLYQAGDLSAVESHIRAYLKKLETDGRGGGLEYASVLNELAGFLRGVSRYGESEAAFQDALAIFRQNGLYESVHYATVLLNLAGLGRLTGKTEMAIALFLEAKDILTACNMQNDYAYAGVLNNLALCYQDTGDYDKALEAASEAFELVKREEDNEHELATSLNNLAAIYFKMGDAEKAEDSVDRALSIYDGMAEPNVHHAAALSMKAALLSSAGKSAEALDSYNKSLELTRRFFGQNIEYAVTEQNIALTCAALGDRASAVSHMETVLTLFEKLLGPDHDRTRACRRLLGDLSAKENIQMNALALSRQYFKDIAEPRLKNDFPELCTRLAAGLVGNGSECFGYDDELSRDHDWGVDFFLWLPERDRDAIPALRDWKDDLFNSDPPAFARARSDYGAHIGVMTVGDFYKSLIGYPEGPETISEWRRVPEENLAMAVNGEVFSDNGGGFSAVREKLLRHFPDDIRRKKLSARCMALAQTGQYNFARCYKRRDWVTLRTVLCRFNDAVLSAVFLLNRVFMPYYKWAYRKMTELPILGAGFGPQLRELALTAVTDDAQFEATSRLIETLCAEIADELRRQGLAATDDWFLTGVAEEIRAGIKDDFLRALPAQYE